MLGDERIAAQLCIRGRGAEDERVVFNPDPAELGEHRKVEVAADGADPCRVLDQRIGAAGERPPAARGQERVRVREGPRRVRAEICFRSVSP